VLDAQGNLAVADDPYSQAQDAASSIRTFHGECYYDTTRGVPYWDRSDPAAQGQILGKSPPISYMQAKFEQAALLVPGVTAAQAFVFDIKARVVIGQVQITNEDGATAVTRF
jgi:hypothetical protein